MAKSFSIERAIVDAFKFYVKNWVMLTLVGAIVSSVLLFDRNTSGHLHQIRTFVKQELPASANVQEAWDKVKCFGRSLSETQNPLKGQVGGFVLWLFLIYFCLGLMRICLGLNAGKNKLDLKPMITMPMDFLHFVGALAVMATVVTVFVVAVQMACVALCWFQLPSSVAYFLITAVVAIFAVYMLHFFFIPWCAADKGKKVLALIECSKQTVYGNLGHLVGFMVLFAIVCKIAKLGLMYIAMPIEGLVHLPGFGCFLVGSVMVPVTILGYTSVYKQLK